VRCLHAYVLTSDDGVDVWRKRAFERLPICRHCHVLTTLGFGQNCHVVFTGYSALEIHPAAMHRARNAPAFLGCAAKPPHRLSELLPQLCPFIGNLDKRRLNNRVRHIARRFTETCLTVAARLNQRIER
jgi:hypothetical protein